MSLSSILSKEISMAAVLSNAPVDDLWWLLRVTSFSYLFWFSMALIWLFLFSFWQQWSASLKRAATLLYDSAQIAVCECHVLRWDVLYLRVIWQVGMKMRVILLVLWRIIFTYLVYLCHHHFSLSRILLSHTASSLDSNVRLECNPSLTCIAGKCLLQERERMKRFVKVRTRTIPVEMIQPLT